MTETEKKMMKKKKKEKEKEGEEERYLATYLRLFSSCHFLFYFNDKSFPSLFFTVSLTI